MKIEHIFISLSAVSLLFLPFAVAQGATFLPVSDEVASLRSETTGDVYAANDSIVITAPVRGDIFAAGNDIDISGSSDASIFAFGRNVSITGEVGDDIRAAGDTLFIGSTVAHDVFAVGSRINILANAQIHGDAYLAGERVTVSGTIHGNLRVAGNIIVIAKGAVVKGDIISYDTKPTIEEGATVSGSVTTIASKNSADTTKGFFLSSVMKHMAALSILGLLLIYTAPRLVSTSKDFIQKSALYSGVIGLAWIVLFLPVSLLLMASGIGTYIGILLFAATFSLFFLGLGCLVIALGGIVYRFIAKKDGVAWQYAIIGAVIMSLLLLLDTIGLIVILLAFLVAFGAVLRAFWDLLQAK